MDEECLWTTALISEDIEEVMLGIDWLQRYECIWDFKTGDLCINGHPAVTLTRHRNADALFRRPVYDEESEEEVGIHVAATNLKEASSLSETRQKTLVSTEKEMTELQAEDPDIAPILRLRLQQTEQPKPEEVLTESEAVKVLWGQWHNQPNQRSFA